MQNHDHTVTMPALGEASTEGTIARWVRVPGDRVSAGDTLAEIVTDKVSEELLAPISGTLGMHLVAAGTAAPVGAPLVRISPETSAAAHSPPSLVGKGGWGVRPVLLGGAAENESAIAGIAVARPLSSDTSPRVAPLVRRLADEHRIDLATVAGTGPGGRVTKDDILAAVAAMSTIDATATGPVESDQLLAPSPLRQTIAANLVRAVQGIPQAWTIVEVDASALLAFRDAHREAVEARTGFVLTTFASFAHVAVRTIAAHPLINAAWREGSGGVGAIGELGGRVVTRQSVNAGLAVARPGGGLLVPVIRDAASLSLDAFVGALDPAISGAREGTLGAGAYSGATVTLNNTGALGSVISQPILPHGTSAIITFEAIVRRPVVVTGDAIAIRPMVNLCLTFDHRVLDGSDACAFLQDLRQRLEALS